jgi:hypothetical protein
MTMITAASVARRRPTSQRFWGSEAPGERVHLLDRLFGSADTDLVEPVVLAELAERRRTVARDWSGPQRAAHGTRRGTVRQVARWFGRGTAAVVLVYLVATGVAPLRVPRLVFLWPPTYSVTRPAENGCGVETVDYRFHADGWFWRGTPEPGLGTGCHSITA